MEHLATRIDKTRKWPRSRPPLRLALEVTGAGRVKRAEGPNTGQHGAQTWQPASRESASLKAPSVTVWGARDRTNRNAERARFHIGTGPPVINEESSIRLLVVAGTVGPVGRPGPVVG